MPNLISLFPNSQAGNPNVLLQGPDAFLNDYLAHNYVCLLYTLTLPTIYSV